jgi:hypothetical protein
VEREAHRVHDGADRGRSESLVEPPIVGHDQMLETPEQVNAMIDRFLPVTLTGAETA